MLKSYIRLFCTNLTLFNKLYEFCAAAGTSVLLKKKKKKKPCILNIKPFHFEVLPQRA